MILLMTISYSCDLIEGTIVKKKHLQKYVSRAKETHRSYRRRSTFGSGNDSQQWMNYLEKYTQPVEELMKLTRNKRHFYQRGRASCNLAPARFIAIFVTPPGDNPEIKYWEITTDKEELPKNTTWYVMSKFPNITPREVGNFYGLRTWVEYGLKQSKNELGWADFRLTKNRKMVGNYF
jgi:hypothetical protein